MHSAPPQIEIQQLSVRFGIAQVLYAVSASIPARQLTALVGRSGSGKSTLLRAVNRLNELTEGCETSGRILLDGSDIYAADCDLPALRRRVGMVLQRSSIFPASIYANVSYGLQLRRSLAEQDMRAIVERSLRRAALWEEVAARLDEPALQLSGGQQQRLCIARALAVEPAALLLDEPTAALDAAAAARIESLLRELAETMTVVVVTHDLLQAQRLAAWAVLMDAGHCVDCGPAEQVLDQPVARLGQPLGMDEFA